MERRRARALRPGRDRRWLLPTIVRLADHADRHEPGPDLVRRSGGPFAVYLSGSEGPFNVPGFGTVDVGGDALFFYSAALDGAGHHAFTLPIPNIPLLIGLKLHLVGYEIAPGGYPQIGAAIVVTLS